MDCSDPQKMVAGFQISVVNHCYYSMVLNDVTSKSHEQRIITKEHIAMHTNLILLLCASVL